jgi:hypothetical protein
MRYTRVIGGKLKASDLKQLHVNGYKDLKDSSDKVGDWVLDRSISKETARVWHNPVTNQGHISHRGTKGLADWGPNAAYVAGLSDLTHRAKESERVQKRAEEKYKDLDTSGHSQAAIYARKYAADKSKVIEINGANKGDLTSSGTVIRSASDPVSILGAPTRYIQGLFKKNNDLTTSAKLNPLHAHSLNILDELGDRLVGGCMLCGARL